MPEKECAMVKRMDAEKTVLHLSTSNKRLAILFFCTVLALVIGFVSAILIFTNANTKREENILNMMARLHGVEVTDGIQQGTN